MPLRSKVRALPDDVRRELDQRLIKEGFGGYAELAGWLAEKGHEIGRSSVHRYGAELERRIERIQVATESAEALVRASGDESGALADASMRMIQERLYDVLMASDESDVKALAAAAKALAETARAGVVVREERRRATAAAERAVADEAKRRQLPPEVAAAMRAAVQRTAQ